MRAILAGLMVLMAGGAMAQQACAPRADMVETLEKRYGEHRVAAGLNTHGSVTEVFASAATGTWTIVISYPDGVSCAVAAGEAWIAEAPAIPGQDG